MSPSAAPPAAEANEHLEPLCAIVTPTGMLGYGFQERLTMDKLEEFRTKEPHLPLAVILDSGSTDSGPEKLALGGMTCPEASYHRELSKLVRAVMKYNVKLLVSSVGGDGSNEHVNLFLKLLKDITSELNCPRKLKVLAVYSEVSRDLIKERLHNENVTGCGDEVPPLTDEEIDLAPTIVGQMGPEPIFDAMAQNPDFDILIAGRAYDPAIYISFCAFNLGQGSPPPMESLKPALLGGFHHMGKILECGGVCTTPKSSGAVAYMYKDGTFEVSALDPTAKCVPLSVAAHTLYEKTRPDILVGPGGELHLDKTEYQQLSDGVTVRVRGGVFKSAEAEGKPYTIKLEGARVKGYRYLWFGYFSDPILISQLDGYLDDIKTRCDEQHPGQNGNWELEFHIFGAPEGRMNDLQPVDLASMPKKVFIVGEVLANTPELAKSVASIGRIASCHGHYKGQLCTGGSFAFGIGGRTEVDVGPCCDFNVYHLVNLSHGEQTGSLLVEGSPEVVDKKNTAGGLFPWRVVETPASMSGPPIMEDPAAQRAKKPAAKLANGHHHEEESVKQLDKAQTLADIATVIRSKNSGPYQVTYDVMFDSVPLFETVKNSGDLDAEAVAKLFGRPLKEVIYCGFFDQALGWKLTLPRLRAGVPCGSGGFGESDVHASQQYMPLMHLKLSEGLKQALKSL